MSEWMNPSIVVREDGIGLMDPLTHMNRILAPEDILAALAKLSREAWPYGRVVMVSENGIVNPAGGEARIQKNRDRLMKALHETKIFINWVPSA